MNTKLKTIAAVFLAAGLISFNAYASAGAPAPAKKHAKHKAAAPKPAPVSAAQLQELKQELEGQINSLKIDLSDRDAKLKAAQETATTAQAAASRAEAAANSQQQAVTDNAAAVTTLQSTVTDMKSNQVQLVTTIQDDQVKVKKAIESPDVLHYKGITITPGGFMAAESIYRTHATGADIPTPFSGIPYENATAYHLSEFFGSGRQSRVSMLAEGKTDWGKLRGYVEADFLGTGTSSNNNQSNSYLMRQRVVWAQAELNGGLSFTGGQMWSLATEQAKGITPFSGDIKSPQTIDPNYLPGFVWTRQYGFRVAYNTKGLALGISAENPQILYSASLAGNTPYAVVGSAGSNGGNYNAAVTGCSTTVTGINPVTGLGTYTTTCTDAAAISFNQAPDVIVKVAVDPGWGHYEVYGIGRFAHQEVYPGETNNAYLYGGLTGSGVSKPSVAGIYKNSTALGGIGGAMRVPLIAKKVDLGFKALYGPGVGRYGDSGLADVTTDQNGEFAPIHNLSALGTLEVNATPRLAFYANYGGDYAGRAAFVGSTEKATYSSTTGLTTFKSSDAPVGYGSKLASISSCTAEQPSGFQGGTTGYYVSGGCGLATRNVQEATLGYWYDFYKGPHGRLRQGLQYGYIVRESWSGGGTTTKAPTFQIKGIENAIWTSFRYYLP